MRQLRSCRGKTSLSDPDSTWTPDPARLSACPFYCRRGVFFPERSWDLDCQEPGSLNLDHAVIPEGIRLLHEASLWDGFWTQLRRGWLSSPLWTFPIFWETSVRTAPQWIQNRAFLNLVLFRKASSKTGFFFKSTSLKGNTVRSYAIFLHKVHVVNCF